MNKGFAIYLVNYHGVHEILDTHKLFDHFDVVNQLTPANTKEIQKEIRGKLFQKLTNELRLPIKLLDGKTVLIDEIKFYLPTKLFGNNPIEILPIDCWTDTSKEFYKKLGSCVVKFKNKSTIVTVDEIIFNFQL
jgi:hypothetical protein